MPTLPERPEPPAGPAERVAIGMRRVSAAVGADAHVRLRVLICLVLAVVGASMAPTPWAQLSLVALLVLGLDFARSSKGRG